MKKSRRRLTECGHGFTSSPCSIRLPPFVACQACAKMVMIGDGALLTIVIPPDVEFKPEDDTFTIKRQSDGTYVYQRPAPPPAALPPTFPDCGIAQVGGARCNQPRDHVDEHYDSLNQTRWPRS